MNCDQVAELLPAYALDALPEDELLEVEEHLASCDLHEEALAFERVAARLPEAIEERAPSAGLRDRILATSRETAAPTAEPGAPPPTPLPPQSARGFTRYMPYAMAAALALVVVAFVALNPFAGDDAIVREATSPDGVSTRLAYDAGDRSAEVTFEGLPALDSASDYQLWTIPPDGVPVSAGLLERESDGSASTTLIGSFDDGTTFAITVEPAGGSDQPTTEPLVATTL
jgi:anti-sigma-K factor RskA